MPNPPKVAGIVHLEPTDGFPERKDCAGVTLSGGRYSMAMKIVAECINCGACEPECPNTAITAGESIYVIDSEKCTECVGAYDNPRCVEVCPVDGCIINDLEHAESKDDLQAKYARLH
jgi:ferredoxin